MEKPDCDHHWKTFIYSAIMYEFLGIKCEKCEEFIAAADIAKYVNHLSGELKALKGAHEKEAPHA